MNKEGIQSPWGQAELFVEESDPRNIVSHTIRGEEHGGEVGNEETHRGYTGLDEGELVVVAELDIYLSLPGMVVCCARVEGIRGQCCHGLLEMVKLHVGVWNEMNYYKLGVR